VVLACCPRSRQLLRALWSQLCLTEFYILYYITHTHTHIYIYIYIINKYLIYTQRDELVQNEMYLANQETQDSFFRRPMQLYC
jgi:hypothetical protein